MLSASCVAPAPLGHEWRFQCSVGVDCSDVEPRCIWLAVLRGLSPCASPRLNPIISQRLRGSQRIIQRHRLNWVTEQRDDKVLSEENRRRPLSLGEVKGVSWKGPRTIFLQKNPQGFGFTLRHFIVYPPESSLHMVKDEENGNAARKAGSRCSHLEPMDTIFVKSVKENSPAQQAGLCRGDRLVKVNGQTILGKTYTQVIALIQNSENALELCIVPKDEDVLQLAYSQDAYLKGNEPCSGKAHNLPEPPPPHYSSNKPRPSGSQPSQKSPMDNHQSCSSPTSSPQDNQHSASYTPRFPPSTSTFTPANGYRGHSSSAINTLNFHFANHSAAIASATLTPPRKSSTLVSGSSYAEVLCHRALSDWYYSHGEAAECMTPRSISQDQLAELRLGVVLRPAPTFNASTSLVEHHRKETLLYHQRAAASSHDAYLLRGLDGVSRPRRQSCSESLLAAYAEYEHNYGRSVETLAQASALVSPHYEKFTPRSKTIKISAGGTVAPPVTSPTVPPTGRRSGQQIAEPQTRRVKEEDLMGTESHRPSFFHKTEHHVLQQTQSFREPSYPGPYLHQRPTDNEGGVVPRLQPSPALSTEEEREPISPISLHQEVVLRQKPPCRCQSLDQTLRHTSCTTPVTSPEPPVKGTPSPDSLGSMPRANGSLAQHALNSLSSIPFIGSFRGRRSSYLLAITTERSRSCDEGLNTFKDESHVFSKLPKRVKSFFIEESLDNLRAQEEARSKRHSTSELGTITFSDVRKEGWLHYKQVVTERGKKVGSGMRPWKRVFSVLRSHSLLLYKDKREAVLHGADSGHSQDENPPIIIRGCLIDIAYSETKRKHTLRLTTQDFCEYLLQAENQDDMLAWIQVIRENSKTDNEEIGFSRQALINKKLNDHRKHSLYSLTAAKPDLSPRAHRMMPPFLLAKTDNTSVNRTSRTDDSKALWGINIMKKAKKPGSPKAFGVRLENCQPALNHKFVPLIVEMCCGMVEASGLDYTGIYRVPGNNAMVSNLQEHLNKGLDINTAEERWQDLNVISSLLKAFFRNLPEPLFTDDKYNDFIAANRIEDAEDRLNSMKKLIHNLPDHYYHTLKFLVGHLKRVADHSEKNKMEPRNLALVFGPTLVRTSEDNMTDMVIHMPDRYKIVETLILHHDWFFTNGQFDNQDKAPEDKQDIQPVPNIDHLLSNIGRPRMPGETSAQTVDQPVRFHRSFT